jgi:hypothetical protein
MIRKSESTSDKLQDAVGVINFEDDGVALDAQQVGGQFGALTVAACDDALGRFTG